MLLNGHLNVIGLVNGLASRSNDYSTRFPTLFTFTHSHTHTTCDRPPSTTPLLFQSAAQLEFVALANANKPTLANINSANASYLTLGQ